MGNARPDRRVRLLLLFLVAGSHGGAWALFGKLEAPAAADMAPHVLQVRWLGQETPRPAPRPKTPPKENRPRPAQAHAPALLAQADLHEATVPGLLTAPPESTPPQPNPAKPPPAGAAATAVETPPNFEADYLSNPAPDYPRLSREFHEQGWVWLRVRVSEAGEAQDVLLDKSSGFERLDGAALNAVRRWRFVPARRGPQAVAAWVLVPVNFILRRNS